MIEQNVLNRLLKRLRSGRIIVTYWDGSEQTYGHGQPIVRVHIKSPKVVRAMVRNLSLAVGETYMSGDLEVDDLAGLLQIASQNQAIVAPLSHNLGYRRNTNRRSKQADYIEHHYDLGNDFYKLWLDNETMAYTCAYYKTPEDSLEQAQQQKFDHVLRKLQLESGQTVAELGCGWGHLLVRAVKHYGVSGIGVTLSREQLRYAQELAEREGVASKAKFELLNYQDLAECGKQFDRVYSVGILEHVGQGNHGDYFQAVDKLLKPGGISVLHSITNQTERPNDLWIDKYIFPGGYIPSLRETVGRLPNFNFRLCDYENLRLHYAMTLDEWWRRFEAHKGEIINMFDERFYRMWRLWLAGSSASFRYGDLDLSQLVFTKGINNDRPLTREHLYISNG